MTVLRPKEMRTRAAETQEPQNYRVHLTVRSVTRLALSAPRPHFSHGRAQGARPPRPAGDAERSTSFEKE